MAGPGRGAKAPSLGLLFTKARRAIAVKSLQSTPAVRDPGPVRAPLVVNSLSATLTDRDLDRGVAGRDEGMMLGWGSGWDGGLRSEGR